MIRQQASEPPVSLAEAQAYVRIETGEEEAVLAGLLRTASLLCEQFIGQALVARAFDESLRASGQWQRLGLAPVRSIGAVALVADDGSETTLAAAEYAVDIDASGDGWVRLVRGGEGLVRVQAVAGMASDANGVPEPLRQGIVRLSAYLYNARDGDGGDGAVAALSPDAAFVMAGGMSEFAGTLRERIVIERPAEERTAMGLSIAGWEPVARCLAAIVPDGAGAEREGQVLSAMARFRVSIRLREGIAIDQRILWGKRVLVIRRLSDEPQRGDRIVMRCEEVRA